ncbi:hypothetical protein UFOVP206_8 [uncultured Caudovirales phage]|uniref:Uncharacterized protein n=1 Tax=uncultured Caudovirales phage TaxID=2100421 RepID=A0A6J7WIX5_9CAUD|nr:hypothetical protein UFOVP206_8 [uncultured Caudovirales phage]
MSSLINLSIKGKDGYKNYTISISDETNQYGQNVTMYEQQSKEERENKVPKKYIGNGSVVWNDGKITNAEKKEVNNTPKVEEKDDLPF